MNLISKAIQIIVCMSLTMAESPKKSLTAWFNPTYAGGAQGIISAAYKYLNDPLRAAIHVDIDLRYLNLEHIAREYPKCQYPIMKFAWHIHVGWAGNHPSGFMNECMPSNTGGQYDPTFACGPGSQYESHPACTTHNQTYTCTDKSYLINPFGCQVGDLSGKFGHLVVKDGKISEVFHDFFFAPHPQCNKPMPGHGDTQWNFVLSAYCPEHKHPRVLCAKGSIDTK